jgi:hypothetical protein
VECCWFYGFQKEPKTPSNSVQSNVPRAINGMGEAKEETSGVWKPLIVADYCLQLIDQDYETVLLVTSLGSPYSLLLRDIIFVIYVVDHSGSSARVNAPYRWMIDLSN